jgi:fatty acid desaturase
MAGMMDHKAFLAAVPAPTRARLTARSDRAGLGHLAGHLGLIVLVGALIGLRVPLWPLLLPVQGALLVFLFTLEHECTHKTPFASIRLNEAAGHLCGLILILPFRWFRYFHLAHHRWTNLPGQDPELDAPPPGSRAAWVWHVSGLPYWGSALRLIPTLATGGGGARYLPDAAMPGIRSEARIMLGVYALAALSLLWSPLLLWVWIVPVLLGQPLLRLYLLAEHGDCPAVADMFLNTRTTFTNRLVRALAWNMPYHVEHHVWPAVPFHQLPAAHRLMRDNLGVTADGYLAFTRDYLARRR